MGKIARLILGLILSLLFSLSSRAEFRYQFQGMEYNFLYRNSYALNNAYITAENDFSLHPVWLNLGAGLELDSTEGELRRYFIEERLKISERNSMVIRLNHLEYPAWEVGVNFVNLYFQRALNRLNWALGLSYSAVNLTDYSNPIRFEPYLDQYRLIYSVSYGFRFYEDKLEFRIGGENFTRFENYGYDHLGPFFELGWQATKQSRFKAKIDLRIVGIGTGLPTLERETVMLGLEWNNPAKGGSK